MPSFSGSPCSHDSSRAPLLAHSCVEIFHKTVRSPAKISFSQDYLGIYRQRWVTLCMKASSFDGAVVRSKRWTRGELLESLDATIIIPSTRCVCAFSKIATARRRAGQRVVHALEMYIWAILTSHSCQRRDGCEVYMYYTYNVLAATF